MNKVLEIMLNLAIAGIVTLLVLPLVWMVFEYWGDIPGIFLEMRSLHS